MTATARIDIDTGPHAAPLAYAFTMQPGDTPRLWLANLQRRADALARDYRGALLCVTAAHGAMTYRGALNPEERAQPYPRPFLLA